MKLGDTLKKIYNSFDFRGNRIKNLRVDTPEESKYKSDADGYDNTDLRNYRTKKDFVANKEYVDKVTTYDTERAKRFLDENKTPFVFKWLGKVFGLSYKELLDELLYPQLPAEYTDPVIDEIRIAVENEVLVNFDNYNSFDNESQYKSNHSKTKYIIWNGNTVVLDVSVKITPGDRRSGIAGKILVMNGDQQVYSFNSDTTNDDYSNIHCSFTYNKNYRIIFRKNYNECDVKNDTFGEPSPIEPASFTLEKDITDLIESECLVIDTLLTHLRTDEESCDTNPDNYMISNHCIFTGEQEGIFDIAIPSTWKKQEFSLGYVMIDQGNNVRFASGVLHLDDLERENLKMVKDGIEYILYQFNFGNTDRNTDVYLYPVFVQRISQYK